MPTRDLNYPFSLPFLQSQLKNHQFPQTNFSHCTFYKPQYIWLQHIFFFHKNEAIRYSSLWIHGSILPITRATWYISINYIHLSICLWFGIISWSFVYFLSFQFYTFGIVMNELVGFSWYLVSSNPSDVKDLTNGWILPVLLAFLLTTLLLCVVCVTVR